MGKGLPGGRRQAGRIDYRVEPRSSLLPDRPRRAVECMYDPRAARRGLLLLLLGGDPGSQSVSSQSRAAAIVRCRIPFDGVLSC